MQEQSFSKTWLPFLDGDVPQSLTNCEEVARFELLQGLRALKREGAEVICKPDLGDNYQIETLDKRMIVTGGERGVLYGTYRLLTALAAGEQPPSGMQQPVYELRMINCWDNADGSVERGYAGRSLFFDGGELSYDPRRIRQLGRMLASVGINVLCINNVNVSYPANLLIMPQGLPKVAALAELLRPFGVRLMLSVDYASPTYDGVPTADPLDEQVQAWWSQCANAVYEAIPDLAGFLVKADSEHRPGPYTYGRDHAQGANMLARALKPHGGALVWRCFVYNCKQDWRDTTVDRPKAAYEHYAYLDGQFDDNVILQIKHGPFDFQVREPLSPLLLAMPSTAKAMELQLAQEYTGHQIDLYAMPGMWKELYEALPTKSIRALVAVGNLGSDKNWTGHAFAQLNLFAFGCYAWDPQQDNEALIRRWCRLSYALPREQEERLCQALTMSRDVYEQYTAPLGIGWMVNPHVHYGPSPDGYEYAPWGTFHKADRNAVGIDRTENGTNYLGQYPPQLRALYESPDRCPDKLLLFFHRLPYGYRMRDGRTLIQRIYDDHFEGLERAGEMARLLEGLDLPQDVQLFPGTIKENSASLPTRASGVTSSTRSSTGCLASTTSADA